MLQVFLIYLKRNEPRNFEVTAAKKNFSNVQVIVESKETERIVLTKLTENEVWITFTLY